MSNAYLPITNWSWCVTSSKSSSSSFPSSTSPSSLPALHPAHAPHSVPGIQPINDTLYVVTCISNPCRYRSRYRLYRAFAKHVQDAGGKLYTVEMAFGDRGHEITHHDDPYHFQLRSGHELWHKENMLNLVINRLPPDAKYIAWIDADVAFARPDWVQETLHQLQHFHVVQMFSHFMDLGPTYCPIASGYGFIESFRRGLPRDSDKNGNHQRCSSGGDYVVRMGRNNQTQYNHTCAWHSGFAWAARREALDAVGGLIDFAVLGSGDRHMAAGLLGMINETVDSRLHGEYAAGLLRWQDRAEREIRRNVGVVEGLLIHYWHGRKKNRFYQNRWKILIDHQFNPQTDIKRDAQGLWQLDDDGSDRMRSFRDALRRYFRSRNEDSVDL